MDYDATDIPGNYDRARDHGPGMIRQWMDTVAAHARDGAVETILDVGCGTGRFSEPLAERFHARVVGIDPSRKMLAEAFKRRAVHGDGRVLYARSGGEALPMPRRSVDLVFISMVFHHFRDPALVARECGRVLRSPGRVFLRTGTRERIEDYPYVRFFPSSRKVLEERLPSSEAVRRVFEEASFRTAFEGVLVQEIAPDYGVYSAKLAAGADSVLASLEPEDFRNGLQALLAYAGDEGADERVSEPIDFFVFTPSLPSEA